MNVHLISLGCPKNLIDSEVMLGQLKKKGVEVAKDPRQADVIIVNTCGFIDAAKKESVDAILQAARFKQEGDCRGLIVSGCLVQRYRSDIAKELPEVDAFMGPDECGKIEQVVQDVWAKVAGQRDYPLLPEQPLQYTAQKGRPQYLYDHQTPRLVLTPKHYAYVKISEGCDNPCKFCIIPRLRGPFRSRPIESVVAEAQKLAAQGVVELNLIAQDLTDYGVDLYGARSLAALLEALDGVQGLRWIRLLYAYPAHVTEDFIEAMARLPKVAKYLDMPVQHLSDVMLKGMGRRLGKQETKDLITRLREQVPGLALRTSLIVGMPGETDAIFEELLEEVADIRFERLGVFTYSREEGTAAHHMKDHVKESVKKSRRAKIMALQQTIALEQNRRLVGTEIEVLVDGEIEDKPGVFRARTQHDAPGIDNTVLLHGPGIRPGIFLRARVSGVSPYDLQATAMATPQPAAS